MLKLITFLALAARSTAINYEGILDDLWTQTDTNGDNKLNLAEFENALTALDITVGMASTNTLNGESKRMGCHPALSGPPYLSHTFKHRSCR